MGSGYRTFTAGEVLTASNVQNFLQNQSVMVFADSTARATSIGTANFEEGMVSYLEDTDTVEVYDGSAWGSIAPATTQGLTLINTTSFSGVASQAVNPFSATYDAYRIIFTLTASSGNPTITFRIRNGVTDNSASNYYFGGFNSAVIGGTVGSYRGNGTSSWTIGDINIAGAPRYYTVMDIVNPFATTLTKASYTGFYSNASDFFGYGVGAMIDNSTSYDGYNILSSTGTITGKVVTYGYNL